LQESAAIRPRNGENASIIEQNKAAVGHRG